jgi:hypothetical protein
MFGQSLAAGAAPTLMAATMPEATGGEYFGPRGIGELWGKPKQVKLARRALDPKVAAQLWAVSEELTGLSFSLG